MTKNEKSVLEQFSYEHILDNLAKYELYYQISLEYLVQQTEFDKDSALKKLEEMALEIEPENVFYTIIAITRNCNNTNTCKANFENELQKHASINALEDYVKKDKELIHPEMFLEETVEKINSGNFFNEKMKAFFDEEYDNILIRWQTIITEKLAENIKEIAQNML
ncbi:MAG: hypothetical protein ACNI3C_09710 [Candidatus Marinarcus sp.]|uniref:hypothetical protein n=1 Tax=Candidatus Marinarcus sp. TaxID=3100987 RepID=UPI003B00F0C3